jgi:REP element-mobilizing transposase RayT
MSELFLNKYNIHSTRLKYWDYAAPAWYYVTICTQDRINFFGRIANGKMHYSEIGIIARKFWLQIPFHHKNSFIDRFTIMPDHMHGILVICLPPRDPNPDLGLREHRNNANSTDHALPVGNRSGHGDGYHPGDVDVYQPVHVETCYSMSLHEARRAANITRHSMDDARRATNAGPMHDDTIRKKFHGNEFSKPKSGSLWMIINTYKGAVTQWCNKNKSPEFEWQNKYWKHVIRNEKELNRIRAYIRTNVKMEYIKRKLKDYQD